jgi:hypothetical protein
MSTRYYADIICALSFQVQLKPSLSALGASPSASSWSRSFHFAESRRKTLRGRETATAREWDLGWAFRHLFKLG